MTTEELLKPRYKVIADYPFNPYVIGDLVTITLTRVLLTVTTEWSELDEFRVDVDNFVPISRLNQYPHLFKQIGWYEERDISEMPEYAKDLENDLIGKVYRILERGLCIGFKDNLVHYGNCLPATEAEFLNYQSTIK